MAVKKPEEYSATGERVENAEKGVSDAAFLAPSTGTVAFSDGEEEAAARAILQEYWSEIERMNAEIAASQERIDRSRVATERNMDDIRAVLRRLQAG